MFCRFSESTPEAAAHGHRATEAADGGNIALTLYCTESVPRREEGSTGKYQHEVKGVPEGAARVNSRDRMLVFSCTPRLESRYRHYPIYKSDEALAMAIAKSVQSSSHV